VSGVRNGGAAPVERGSANPLGRGRMGVVGLDMWSLRDPIGSAARIDDWARTIAESGPNSTGNRAASLNSRKART